MAPSESSLVLAENFNGVTDNGILDKSSNVISCFSNALRDWLIRKWFEHHREIILLGETVIFPEWELKIGDQEAWMEDFHSWDLGKSAEQRAGQFCGFYRGRGEIYTGEVIELDPKNCVWGKSHKRLHYSLWEKLKNAVNSKFYRSSHVLRGRSCWCARSRIWLHLFSFFLYNTLIQNSPLVSGKHLLPSVYFWNQPISIV